MTKVNLAPSLRNWIGEILNYDFDIVHLPGLANHLPDALSRLYEPSDSENEQAVGIVMATVVDGALELMEASKKLELVPAVYNEDLDQLAVVNDLTERNDIMGKAHDGLHEGAEGMARKIRSSYRTTWANLEKDCQEFVRKCIKCQRFNTGRHGYSPPKSMLALFPFDHICIDLKEMPLSDRGNNYYLLVIDVATRFIFLRALKDKTAYSVAQALFLIFTDVGFPKMIQSDNGMEFVNEVMTSVKVLANVMERLIAPYSHKSNGMAERAIRTTSMAVWKTVEGRVTNWDRILPAIQFNFNNRVMEVHGSTPYSLVFARRANDFFDYSKLDLIPEEKHQREQRLLFLNSVVFPEIKEKIKRHVKKRNEYFVKTHRISKSDYIDGSYVMMKTYDKGPKYKAKYEGPLKVVGREASGAYRLQSLDGTEYVRSPDYLKMVVPDIVKDLNVTDTVFAAVSKVIEHQDLEDRTRLYRVRWENQTSNHDSWLKESDFNDLGPIQDYEKNIVKANQTTKVSKPKRAIKEAKNDVLDSNGLLKESVTIQDFLRPVSDNTEPLEPATEQINQETLLSDDQKKAWGPKQFIQHPKRLHKPAIVETESDNEQGVFSE
jgi:transposase InsO family protein